MYDFSGKFSVVTVAAKGIDAATAARFVKEGIAGVALLDMDIDTAKKLDRLPGPIRLNSVG